MKNLKVLMILLSFIISNEILAQQEQYVFIQMYSEATKGGGGVAKATVLPIIVETIDAYGKVTLERYEYDRKKNNEWIETTPILKTEIEKWSKQGFKLKEFELNRLGMYIVIMVKEE